MLGVITRDQALDQARQAELTWLKSIQNDVHPCKIMTTESSSSSRAEKFVGKSSTTSRPRKFVSVLCVGQNDLDIKIKHAREFLEHKDKVMLVCLFKGREVAPHGNRLREDRADGQALEDNCQS